MGNPSYPGVLEETTDWPENRDFGDLSKEVTCAKRPPIQEKYAVLTGGSCHGGNHQKWKEAAVWSLTQPVAEVTER